MAVGVSAKKKGQLALARRIGIISLREFKDPVLPTPGGWGLRNPVPKGPGQRSDVLIAIQRGTGLSEFWQHYDLFKLAVKVPTVEFRACR